MPQTPSGWSRTRALEPLPEYVRVALLEAGACLQNASVLLGHTSIRVTGMHHYNPWVKSRHDALDKAVKKAIGF